ncbi:MAG TPA: cupin domain-containing protein [Thermodesulfobacteriota bacterium]|nr:cupin domain-containing protein [Thermodesulfobacteriota bacterium]
MQLVDLAAARRFAPAKMQKVGLFETDRLFCDLYCFEPGQEQTAHTHPGSDKVYVVLEGQARIRVGGAEERLAPMQATLAPAGAEHAVTNDGPDRLVLLVFVAPRP